MSRPDRPDRPAPHACRRETTIANRTLYGAACAGLLVLCVAVPARADGPVPLRPRVRPLGPESRLSVGDRLVVEASHVLGLEAEGATDPLVVQVQVALRVAERARGVRVVEARIGIRSLRYRGPAIAFEVRPSDDLPGVGLARRTTRRRRLTPVVTGDAVLDGLLDRERPVALAWLALDGAQLEAAVQPGPAPWVELLGPVRWSETLGAPEPPVFAIAHRLLRGLLLLAFPPVPLALDPTSQVAFRAGGVPHEIVGSGHARFPLPALEVETRALAPTAYARAFYGFEAVTDLGLRPRSLGRRVRETARVAPRFGVAVWRQVDVRTEVSLVGGRRIEVRSRWLAMVTRARIGGRRGASTDLGW